MFVATVKMLSGVLGRTWRRSFTRHVSRGGNVWEERPRNAFGMFLKSTVWSRGLQNFSCSLEER